MASTVMLVDDDTPFRTSLIKLLRRAGMTVSAFGTAEDAAHAAVGCCPDVAILDVSLPGMNGGQLAHLLSHRCPNTRVIFVTGDRTPLGKFPRGEIMDKPVSPQALLDRIQGSRIPV